MALQALHVREMWELLCILPRHPAPCRNQRTMGFKSPDSLGGAPSVDFTGSGKREQTATPQPMEAIKDKLSEDRMPCMPCIVSDSGRRSFCFYLSGQSSLWAGHPGELKSS